MFKISKFVVVLFLLLSIQSIDAETANLNVK